MRPRVLAGALCAIAVLAVTALSASAAGLGGLTPGSLGSGSAAVEPCDADGFTYDFTISTGLVTAVVVGDVADPACEGGTMQLALVDAAGTALASGTAAIATDADTDVNLVTVSLSVQPLLSNVDGVHAAVVGP